MSTFEDLGRAWAAAAAALDAARAERDAADREYADVLDRAFDTVRSNTDRERGRLAIETRAAAAEKVQELSERERVAHMALLDAAMELSSTPGENA